MNVCMYVQDYRENLNPINSKPIKLWQYDLETDPRFDAHGLPCNPPFIHPSCDRKYAKNVTSVSSTVKSAMMGNEDFAMKDLLTSQDDLQLASRSFKFGLVPKVTTPPHYLQVRLA